MAQVSFVKLAPKLSTEVVVVHFNDQEIEVKQYLPIAQKLEALTNILNMSVDSVTGYYNPVKVEVFLTLEIIYHYTNIKFTDKQKEDTQKLYDLLISSGLYNIIKNVIPQDEYNWFYHFAYQSMDQIYKYRDSIYGILDAMKTDYNNTNFNIATIMEQIKDPETLGLMKEILPLADA